MCHIALLLPFLTLPMFWLWPLNVALPLYLMVLAFSAVIYYLAFAAMRRPVMTGREHLIGNRTRVIDIVEDKAYVRLDSERWQVECRDLLRPGDEVEVVGFDGARAQVRRTATAACEAIQ